MIRRTRLMLHHSLTKDSQTVSWPAIRKYHKLTKGWQDIGYHFGVELTGDEYEALIGRSLEHNAAACPEGDMNRIAVHVCLVGNFDKTPPPPEQLEVFRDRIWLPMADLFQLTPKDIVFHRDFAPWKTCPGSTMTRALLAQYIPGV